MAVHEIELRGVPDVVEQQRRGEHQRPEHRERALPIAARESIVAAASAATGDHTESRPGPGKHCEIQHGREARSQGQGGAWQARRFVHSAPRQYIGPAAPVGG